MNKKYLAIVMAGATVATSVAPVFAEESENVVKETITVKDSKSLVTEVENLLKIKYNGDGETVAPVYEIKVDDVVINDAKDLKKKIEAIPNNGQLVVSITNKGYDKDENNNIVSKAVGIYKTYADLSEEVKNITTAATDTENKEGLYGVATATAELKKTTDDQDILSIHLKSKKNTSDKTIELKLEDKKINLKAKPLDSKGEEIDITEDMNFSEISKLSDAEPEDIPSKIEKVVTIKNGELDIVSATDIYDGYRLSSRGVEIIKDKDKKASEISTKDSQTGKYSYVVKYVDASSTPIELTVESTNYNTLDKSRNALMKNDVKVEVLAGEDRYATAIEIAKKSGLNNNIVIVNSNKIVDGLAATPFAKLKGAPILLSSDTEIPQVTLDYIKSVIKSNPSANIYIVGGKSAVSTSAEKQLTSITKNVQRFAGEDRHTTSLAIANEMNKTNEATKAYVVGAKGEPDAMSIAAKAAEDTSPIVVNGWEGLSKDSMDLLKDKEIDIIGGVDNVTASTETSLKEIAKDKKVDRVEGETRHDTNAKVIEHYYENLNNLYVAKDGYGNNNMLIDALAAGPLAAGNGPILLSTEQLTDSQEKVLNTKVTDNNKGNINVVQIGNGIKTAVYTKLASILGW
jgi:hypothetical protein